MLLKTSLRARAPVIAVLATFAVLFGSAASTDCMTSLRLHSASQFMTPCAAAPFAFQQGPDVPNFPTPPRSVDAMLRLARVTKDDVVYDLGCGDGRIVIAAARDFGARGVGVDIDPQCVRDSEANARKARVSGRARFRREDLFKTDLSGATVVALYLSPELNRRLIPKLLKELKPGSRVVAHVYDMGAWEPDKTVDAPGSSKYKLYLWTIPAQVAGTWRWTGATSAGAQSDLLTLTQRYQRLEGTLRFEGRALQVFQGSMDGAKLHLLARGGAGGVEADLSGVLRGGVLMGALTVRRAGADTVINISARREESH